MNAIGYAFVPVQIIVTDAEFNEFSGNANHLSSQERNSKLLDMITTKGTDVYCSHKESRCSLRT